ncbi:MAG TPA: hypothetical protein VMU39_10970, partial [Solirubrobacteraceae bacterium]|nr:hypothetical protein [Solirubrobacteraceae bacterium]
MPFALLLDETLRPFVRGARRLEPWIKLMDLQTEMLERARGFFLYRWFGHATPFEGRRPVVAIVNLGQLKTRLLAVRQAETGADPLGPSLLEPLAGMAGSALGLLLSPSGAVAASYAAFRLSRSFITKAVALLNMLTLGVVPFAFGWLIAGIGLPLSLVLALFVGPQLPALLASFARLGIALRRFWEIVSGPRDRVANPVLRELLELGDRVAALLVQLV